MTPEGRAAPQSLMCSLGQTARHRSMGCRLRRVIVLPRRPVCGRANLIAFATVDSRRFDAAMLAPLALILALTASPNPSVADSVRSDREIRLAALRHVADVKRCYEREGLTRDP